MAIDLMKEVAFEKTQTVDNSTPKDENCMVSVKKIKQHRRTTMIYGGRKWPKF